MTERTAHDASVTACPFVAFVDDRDERADVPDHRHRCYAEIRPAQRALAHQQAFCLSASFAECPTFQDWARRESARARASSGNQRPASDAPEIAPADPSDVGLPAAAAASIEDIGDPEEAPFDDRAIRNPHRDWADPPPWTDPGALPPGPDQEAPGFLAGRPSGHDAPGTDEAAAAAGLSASRWLQDVPPPRDSDGNAPPRDTDDELERALAEDRANRERAAALAVGASATASSSRAARKASPPAAPQKVSAARGRPPDRAVAGPSWERPRRYEAYPTLKTRIGLPSIPRIGLAALAVIVAALVLFSLPFLLRLVGGAGAGGALATPTPTAAASASVTPSDAAPAAPKVYVVKPGDTLLKIARKYGLTVDQLLAANKQIKNPNKIAVGDEIVIPVAAPSEVVSGASSEPSASP
jgi:nucleoid-associated protein YgaU